MPCARKNSFMWIRQRNKTIPTSQNLRRIAPALAPHILVPIQLPEIRVSVPVVQRGQRWASKPPRYTVRPAKKTDRKKWYHHKPSFFVNFLWCHAIIKPDFIEHPSVSIYLSVSRLYLNICIYIYLDIYDVVKGSNRAHHGSHLLPLATCISACISAARCSSCGENPWIGTVISKGGALGH